MQDYLDVIRTNQERIAVINAPYNPVTGEGSCGERKRVRIKDSPIEEIYLPESMIKENTFVRRLIRYGLKGYVKKFHDGDPEFEELLSRYVSYTTLSIGFTRSYRSETRKPAA